MDQPVPDVFNDASQNFRTNCMGFVSFSILIWDHAVTFSDEVEHIWKGKRHLIHYLFLINRYLTPLGFVVNLIAYLSPTWTPEKCKHFIRFEGSMTIIGIEIVALMMLLRIHAIYPPQYPTGRPSNKWIVGGVASILVIETVMNAWLMTRGEPVLHNPQSGVRACTMIFDPKISAIASSSAWLPLLYDTTVLILTLVHSIRPEHRSNRLFKRLRVDGLIYYSAIFSVTLVLTIMVVDAPAGDKSRLKNITAQLELLITVTMMSRITLNLKRSGVSANHHLPSAVSDRRTTASINKPPRRKGSVSSALSSPLSTMPSLPSLRRVLYFDRSARSQQSQLGQQHGQGQRRSSQMQSASFMEGGPVEQIILDLKNPHAHDQEERAFSPQGW